VRASLLFAQDLGNLSDQKPIGFSGSLSLSGTAYGASGIPERRTPFSWLLSGSPTLSIYGIQLPFTFLLSDQDRSFRQPFNQFGVSPTYKSAIVHLGYRSMNFSRYSLAGVTFLGGGLEFNPGILRLGAMTGRFQRAVEEDTNLDVNVQPAYERTGYALKLGLGTSTTFFDLNYLHATDDSNSIRFPTVSNLTPMENAVVGFNSRVSIIPELWLEAEGAVSALTRDIRDSVADIDVPAFVTSLISGIRPSTSVTTAGRAALVLSLSSFSLRLGYERVEPDFTSLGAYYFTTDVENYTIAPTINLLGNKLRLSGSIGIQHDNLLNLKLASTQRIIGSSTVSWNPTQIFGVDAYYTNYSTDQSSGRAPLNDSIKVRNVSRAATLSPRIVLQNPDMTQTFSLIGSMQEYSDLNARTNAFTNSNTKTATLTYAAFFTASGTSVGGSLLYADTKAGIVNTTLLGFNANGAMTFLENALTVGATVGLTHSSLPVGLTFNESISSTYKVSESGSLNFSVYATQNSATSYVPDGFSETTATLTYTHSFSY